MSGREHSGPNRAHTPAVEGEWNPGEGWRETDDWDRATLIEYGEDGDRLRMWVRVPPVPPLPTAPYTVIRVQQKNEAESAVLTLAEDGYWYLPEPYTVRHTSQQLSRIVDSFVVLSEPRAVTAKAVLDRIYEVEGSNPDHPFEDDIVQVSREFGVES